MQIKKDHPVYKQHSHLLITIPKFPQDKSYPDQGSFFIARIMDGISSSFYEITSENEQTPRLTKLGLYKSHDEIHFLLPNSLNKNTIDQFSNEILIHGKIHLLTESQTQPTHSTNNTNSSPRIARVSR